MLKNVEHTIHTGNIEIEFKETSKHQEEVLEKWKGSGLELPFYMIERI